MDLIYIVIPVALIFVLIIFFLIRHFFFSVKIEKIEELIKQKNYNEAVKQLKKLVHKDDSNSLAHFYLGEAYFYQDNFEWALPHYKKVLNMQRFGADVTEVRVRERVAEIYLHFQKPEEAQKELLMILKLKPDDYRYYFRVGEIFYQRFYKENAIIYFKKALEVNPSHTDSLFYLGEIYFTSQRYSETLEMMKKILQIDPNYYKAHYYLGMANLLSRNYLQAMKDFEVSTRDPDYRLRSLLQLGKASIETGNVEKGILELERALQYIEKEDKVSCALRYQLSSAYEKTRDLTAAIEQWEIIYGFDPNYQDVGKKLDDFSDLRLNDQLKDFMTASDNRFEALCRKIVDNLKLDVTEIKISNRGTLATIVSSEKESEFRNVRRSKQLIKIYRISDKLSDNKIREILEEMKDVGALKSYCVTASEYTRQAVEYAGNRPIELYDKNKISYLLK